MIHKPRNRELSILLTAHCLDKIHIFVKFRPKGSEVMAYKQYFTKDSQFNSKKSSYRFCSFHMVLMRLIESMMVLRPRQGNLRQVFRLFKSHARLCRA